MIPGMESGVTSRWGAPVLGSQRCWLGPGRGPCRLLWAVSRALVCVLQSWCEGLKAAVDPGSGSASSVGGRTGSTSASCLSVLGCHGNGPQAAFRPVHAGAATTGDRGQRAATGQPPHPQKGGSQALASSGSQAGAVSGNGPWGLPSLSCSPVTGSMSFAALDVPRHTQPQGWCPS